MDKLKIKAPLNQAEKIAIVQRVLDELATVGVLTCQADKQNSLEIIREILKDFTPQFPTHAPDLETTDKIAKGDVSIYAMKLIAGLNNTANLDKKLKGIAELSEKALTELLTPNA